MRKITVSITSAFESNKALKSGNDEVKVTGKTTELFLHGHLIATKTNNILKITNAGYFTNVTKERLNGLSGVSVNQKNGKWFLNGIEWDGKLITVK